MKRLLKHLFIDDWAIRRVLPHSALVHIEQAIRESEKRHSGEITFVVEASLASSQIIRGQTARGRAIEVFSLHRVWDTEHNSGVLIYLLLADRDIEIVVDRGINKKVSEAEWQTICHKMEQKFIAGKIEEGVIEGINAISTLLAQHFSSDTTNINELPDKPVVL